MRIRLFFHTHTEFSYDSNITLKQIIYQCKKHNVNCIGITDHNTIEGALNFKKDLEENGIKVIIGEEIMTSCGEVIGLFINKEIEHKNKDGKLISLKKAISEINKQNGLVFVPHPFDKMRHGIGKDNVEKFIDRIDAIEAFNSRTKLNFFNKKADNYIRENNLTPFIGSDAHIERELSHAIIQMKSFNTKDEFLKNLRSPNTKFLKQRLKLVDIIRPTMNKYRKKLFRY